jgi:nucleotide-binding universal stress UspA family protein
MPPAFRLKQTSLAGPIERAAFERAREFAPDVLVMTSRGHDQLSDVLFASHTERVLHAVVRPLLWIPARWTRDRAGRRPTR